MIIQASLEVSIRSFLRRVARGQQVKHRKDCTQNLDVLDTLGFVPQRKRTGQFEIGI